MFETYVTFRGLSRRTGVPLATLHARIRDLGVEPDAIAVEPKRSTMLFRVDRLEELRRVLQSNRNHKLIPT